MRTINPLDHEAKSEKRIRKKPWPRDSREQERIIAQAFRDYKVPRRDYFSKQVLYNG